MTVFRNPDRKPQTVKGAQPTAIGSRLQHWKGKIRQQAASMTASIAHSGRKNMLFAGGALALLVAVGFGGTYYVKINTTDYAQVLRNGVSVGTVSDPKVVQELLDRKLKQAEQQNPGLRMVLDSGELTYKQDRAFKAKTDDKATLAKLEGMLATHAVGVEVRVNGKLIGIAKDKQTADAVLKRVQSKFVPERQAAATARSKVEVTALAFSSKKTAAAPRTKIASVKFVEKVGTDTVSVDPERIQDADTLYKRLVTGNTKPTKYTIQAGDCIGCIADKFSISPQLIYQNNPWITGDEITAGDVLDLTVLQPQLTVETVENVTETAIIEPSVIVQKNDQMRSGQQKIIRKGVPGSKQVTYQLVKQNGYLMSEQLLDQKIVAPAIPAIVMKGTKVILGEGTGDFAWPVTNPTLTSSFGQRWGRLHKGLDIVGASSIRSADDGVVEFAGTRNGTGKTIIINHKNGYKTVYAHLSKIDVKQNAIVQKGDKIGVMGNTGNSFGVHLHFEIHKDGKVQNPITYL
ncbi:M23 family metallopeptidase [Paenibacillus darwinianus]|uniref:M23 family metallopeptidase n=1 Tax=Paenibacillus darwinianus TaxID=1380763 RepID=UPI0004517544|nr:M23 family metallopeptidase [Paenibacillus darwinianus]EXX85351.1 membrane protein [Paenibacillus darwinianus]